MTVSQIALIAVFAYVLTLLIAVSACLSNYCAGVRDAIGYLKDPSDIRYGDAGDLIESEGLDHWLKQERLSRSLSETRCEHVCRRDRTRTPEHHPSKDGN